MKTQIEIMEDVSWLLRYAKNQVNPRVYAMGRRGTVTQYLIDNHIDQRPDKDEIAGHIRYMASKVLR